MDRPTFMHDGQPVRAAGLLVYVSDMDGVHVLFRHAKGKITDIGGKTDAEDTCVEDTVIREVWEETNGNLYGEMPPNKFARILHAQLRHHSTRRIYNAKSKYLLFVVRESPAFLGLPMQRFGRREHHDGMKHYYRWLGQDEIRKRQVHFRLRLIQHRLVF